MENSRGKEVVLRSGAKLFISWAPFEKACQLFKAVAAATKRAGIPKNAEELDLIKRESTMMLFCDPDVYRLAFECSASATYEGRKIDASLFDDNAIGPKASSDLVEIFSALVDFHTARFFPIVSSASGAESQGAAAGRP